jgi:DNA-binding NarL/FixJ family response regulator
MEASTQAQACKWLEKHGEDWDLAVVDLFLASGNGLNVLRKCVSPNVQQKVVMITNYQRDRVEAHARAAGVDAFFDKTTQLEDLVDFCSCEARRLTEQQPVNRQPETPLEKPR